MHWIHYIEVILDSMAQAAFHSADCFSNLCKSVKGRFQYQRFWAQQDQVTLGHLASTTLMILNAHLQMCPFQSCFIKSFDPLQDFPRKWLLFVYKQQLSIAAEREEILERAKVQIELDWQRRCEDAERNQYQKSEALIQSLSAARDQVIAELQEKKQKLHELEMTLAAVTFERDQAIQELQKHGHLPKGEKQTISHSKSFFICKVFSQTLSPSDYVQSLEEEIKHLKKKSWAVDKQHKNPPKLPGKSFVSSQNSSICTKSTQTSHQDRIVSGKDGKRDNNIATDNLGLRKHKTEALQMDVMETQNPANEMLQVNSVHLRQQLGEGDGPHQHIENNARWLYNKLKEAARKICSLSKEKQQLLEMVNGLRAEFGTASKEGRLGYKNFGLL
ncbi:hypothetical protein JD844_011493 [Phrynosoma platyrhinos]|uniref:Uncharacterized protein n=1 Tax=Phrynosoma platyrhinos TaxID=52577 RepID=A0ABQ7TII0_PHRPL|nr:hypothetical protein JD844_011493 [Phrynosoma platyrhinos]